MNPSRSTGLRGGRTAAATPRWTFLLWMLVGAAPPAAGQWYFGTVSTSAYQADFAVDAAGKPWVSYIEPGACPQVKLAEWTVDRWTPQTVDATCVPINAPTGIALMPSGEPSVLYWRTALGQLRISRRAAGVWSAENVPLTASEYDFDYAVDAAGEDHVYFVANSTSFSRIVSYAKKDGGVWQSAFIRGSSTANLTLAGLGVDAAGDAYLAYYVSVFPTDNYVLGKKSTGAFAVIFSTRGNLVRGLDVGPDDRVQFLSRPQINNMRVNGYPPLASLQVPDPGNAALFTVDAFSRARMLSAAFTAGGAFITETTADGALVTVTTGPLVSLSTNLRASGIGAEDRPLALAGNSTLGPILVGARLAAVPPIAAVARTTSSITWAWTPSSATALVTGFRVRRFSDNADLSGLLPPSANTWAQTGLALNAQSTVYLEAYHPGVAARSSSSTAQSSTFAPAAVELTRLGSGGLTVSWSAAGNPPTIDYAVTLLGAGGLSNTQVTNNPSYNFPGFSPAEPTAVLVEALSQDGARFPMSSTTSFAWDGQNLRLGFALPATGLSVEAAVVHGPGSPQRAFAASDAEGFPTHARALVAVTATGQAFNFAATNPALNGQAARLEVSYPAGRFDAYAGIPLLLARYDPDRDVWLLLATQHDAAARRISANIDRFGLFQVMARPAQPASLALTALYPNPFRPGAGAVLSLREVPPGATVKILAVSGRVLRELTAGDSGALEWDGKDGTGGFVRSGVYVLRVKGAGGEKNLRLVVER